MSLFLEEKDPGKAFFDGRRCLLPGSVNTPSVPAGRFLRTTKSPALNRVMIAFKAANSA
jgi:hypothetical protein